MRILLFLILQISFWANSVAQKDISVSAENMVESKFTFGYEIGMGVQGATKLTYSQGFVADYRFARKWLVGTELKFSIFNDKFNDTEFTDKLNDQGEIVGSKRLIPSRANYVEIPINISFDQRKTRLTFGVSNCFLTGVKGNIETSNFQDPLSSFFIFPEIGPTQRIEPYGFRKYHLRGHLSAAFNGRNGFGIKFKVFQPISKISKSPSEIPTGKKLFIHSDQPGGFSIHLVYLLPKNMFAQE